MHYAIRVKDHVGSAWQEWFAPLHLEHEAAGTTLFSGWLPDQAALFGVLLKLHNLGVTLIALDRGETLSDQLDVLEEARKRSSHTGQGNVERS